jgi:hypothetical protein
MIGKSELSGLMLESASFLIGRVSSLPVDPMSLHPGGYEGYGGAGAVNSTRAIESVLIQNLWADSWASLGMYLMMNISKIFKVLNEGKRGLYQFTSFNT